MEKKIQFESNFGEITKATAASEMEIVADGEFLCNTSLDLAMMFRVEWWPEVAEKWKSRERKWPTKQIIENITTHCYIIAKPSDKDKSKIRSAEFSYSFHAVEAYLAQQRTRTQRFVYLVFKALVYKYLKPLNTDKIPSFWGKNIMMWTTEQYPPECPLWEDAENGVKHLLKTLLNSARQNQLNYFFIPSVNLMEVLKKDEDLQQKICHTLNSILASLDTHIQRLDVCKAISFYGKVFDTCEKIPTFLTSVLEKTFVVEDSVRDRLNPVLHRLRKRYLIN